MTRSRACWVLLAVVSLSGCDGLKKLFEQDKHDGGPTTTDAGLVMTDAAPGGPDVGPGAPDVGTAGRDAAVTVAADAKPSLAVEAPAIKATVAALGSALAARNVDGASTQFTIETRPRYRTMFEAATGDKLDKLAAALAKIEVTTVLGGSVDDTELRGEAIIALDGRTFHVSLVKVDNLWLLETL